MRKFFNLRVPLFVFCQIISGILTSYFFISSNTVGGIVTATISLSLNLIFLVFYTKKENFKRNVIILIALLLFFAVGFGELNIVKTDFENADCYGVTYTVEGRVSKIDDGDGCSQIILDKVKFGDENGNARGYKLKLYLYGNSGLEIGKVIRFTSKIYDYGIIFEGKFYASNLANKVKYYTSIDSENVEMVGEDLNIFQRVNLFIKNTLKNNLDEDEFGVGYALLCGNSEDMDENVISKFREAGVAHIFAVSGLHIGFFATVIGFILKKLKVNKYVSIIITIPLLFFYSGVCGFSASSIRAAIMTSVFFIVNMTGKRYDGLSSLSIAGIIILLVSPAQLFCIGTQLSFGVVLGILLLSNPISKIFKFLPKKIASALGVVLSAQLSSIPISLYAFGQFSVISVMINLTFVPVVGIVYELLLTCTLLCGITGLNFILFVPNYILKAVIFLITAFDYKFFIIEGASLGLFSAFYYLALITPCGLINLKFGEKAICSLLCLAILSVGVVANSVKGKGDTVCVSYSSNFCATVIDSENETSVIVSDYEKGVYTSPLERAFRNLKSEKIDNLIFLNKGIGIQNAITKLNMIFTIENVYYYDVEKEYRPLNKSFGHINFVECKSGEETIVNKNIKIVNGGKIAIFSNSEFNCVIFSRFGEGGGYEKADVKDIDLLVSYDYGEQINAIYKPIRQLSYTLSPYFKNAEESGNLYI